MSGIILSRQEALKLGLSVESDTNKPIMLVQIGYDDLEEDPSRYYISSLANEILMITNNYVRHAPPETSYTVFTGKELYEYFEGAFKIPQECASSNEMEFSVDEYGMISCKFTDGIIIWTSEMDTSIDETPYGTGTLFDEVLSIYGIKDL